MLNKQYYKNLLKKITKSTVFARCFSFLMFLYATLVGKTTKWKYVGLDNFAKISNKPVIWIAWHSRATMMPFFWKKVVKNRRMSALVSPHQDGQLIANFLRWYGISPVNGSTNERARQSALELMRDLQNGIDLFISPDGPRGPRMRMKKSPIYFAQKTGAQIVCVCFSSKKAFIAEKAWDKTMIAYPFTEGVFATGKPLEVPANLTDDEVEKYRSELENIANKLSFECDKYAGREPVLPADENDYKMKKI